MFTSRMENSPSAIFRTSINPKFGECGGNLARFHRSRVLASFLSCNHGFSKTVVFLLSIKLGCSFSVPLVIFEPHSFDGYSSMLEAGFIS